MFVSIHPVEPRQVEELRCGVADCTDTPAAQIAYELHGRSGAELVCAGHVLAAARQAASSMLFGRLDG